MRTTSLTGAPAPACLTVILMTPLMLSSLSGSPARAQEVDTRVSRVSKWDGSASVNATGSLDVWSWTRLGVDLSVPMAGGASLAQAAVPAATQTSGGSGAAWATLNIPVVSSVSPWEKGKVDVRLDPVADERRVSTVFSRQWALSDHLSATLSDTYALIRTADGGDGWETGKSVGLSLAEWGTSLKLGTSVSSGSRTWQPSFTASQSLVGPLKVSATLASDDGSLTRSISAGFRGTW